MKRLLIILLLTPALFAQEFNLGDLLGDQPKAETNRFVVHEWGSINLIQGSDEAVIGGLVDDQSDLPDFVEVWKENPRSMAPMIIEKPIIYFYTKKPLAANVVVECPKGILTQWWPMVDRFHPPAPRGGILPKLQNGRIEWNFVSLNPDLEKPAFRDVKKHPWWPKARDTDATVARVHGIDEKFLFYRGVTSFSPALSARHEDTKWTFTSEPGETFPNVLAIHVGTDGTAEIDLHASLAPGKAVSPQRLGSVKEAADTLQTALEHAGLYEKEANGLVEIWHEPLFETPGSRFVYFMKDAVLDAMLPLKIRPTPDELKRVMLVRVELLTQAREQEIMRLILALGGESYRDREAAQNALMKQGRAGQALMRKVLRESDDPEITHRLAEILSTISPLRPGTNSRP